ncbi:DUF2283 domain-containing protein [Archaeoglobus profundus]|uniref:DUF2283 domain-containing protein n=1 Tax=Archaeoglobus profundus (strain DSM 5631 / JCM 9629 / NBRC 100127 / Av18) TaxID=572546 RepID=D2RFV9_ARCPA|nr:DUF2283 domain-containing protein [Archaeoglobus profundus]ADB57184.1 conserved hypothetical protein [Archaeoglobus profundus DSM 5631]
MVSVEFDPEVNALYIRLKDGKVKTSEPLADNIIIDLDENDEVLGIEILLPAKSEISKRLAEALIS